MQKALLVNGQIAFTKDVARGHLLKSIDVAYSQRSSAVYQWAMSVSCAHYKPKKPETTVLHQVVSANFQEFIQLIDEEGKHFPNYVEKEFYSYLDCGRLEKGFARLKCDDCKFERLLPFSCKRRGFCPSCCGRRMNEAELKIVEEIFPHQNARQWVLSIPIPVRFFAARNRQLVNALTAACYQVICKLIRRKLRARGISKTTPGGIVFIQRLGGALNLNVHYHAIFLDGAFTAPEADGKPLTFHDLEDSLTSEDIAWAVTEIAKKSVKAMKKLGLLDGDEELQSPEDLDAINLCDGASVKNVIAFGERSGKPVRRIRLAIDPDAQAVIKGNLVAELNGFNLKADRLIKGHQRWKLSRLVRYVARPPLATDRLKLSDDGKTVRYSMKRPWSDGTTEVVLSGVELIEKLAAAVPPPRGHLVRYVGVFAPNSKLRANVVTKPKPKARDENGKLKTSATARAEWALLMKRAFGFDLKVCPLCSGNVRQIAVIMDTATVRKILDHTAARPPPLDRAS